jgi:hypothetical protein
MRTTAAVAIAGLIAALIATQRQDIVRYLRIRQMSAGQGHPEYVPVEGRAAYPQD